MGSTLHSLTNHIQTIKWKGFPDVSEDDVFDAEVTSIVFLCGRNCFSSLFCFYCLFVLAEGGKLYPLYKTLS